MPDDPAANLLMVCTGTGSAPMRAMTERLVECYRAEVSRMRQDQLGAETEKVWTQAS